jgi:hypothetical protein
MRICGAPLVALVLTIQLFATPARAIESDSIRCERIRVESRDRANVLSSYIVSEPEFVARMRLQIEQHGQDGTWTVAAGELGSLGYTVTYTCLP